MERYDPDHALGKPNPSGGYPLPSLRALNRNPNVAGPRKAALIAPEANTDR